MSRGPRILMDCTAIPPNHGGVARYIHGVLSGLNAEDIDLHVVAQARDKASILDSAPWATVHTIPRRYEARPLRLVWEQFSLPRLARRIHADVVHSPHYTFPLLWRGSHVVTVHDATFFSHPEVHNGLKRLFFRTWIRRAWKGADSIIVPSGATASELERLLGRPARTVAVAHLGVDLKRFHRPTPAELADFRAAHGIARGERWFAFLGTIEPRKNVSALLDAYFELKATLPDPVPKLFIAGARGWDTEALARLDALDPSSGVNVLGFVDNKELAALLGGAVAVVYPSHGEGFGLPVVEAMACGATVVTSPHLAIPEVGGDAVIYSETDARSIAQALRFVLDNEAVCIELRARAAERAGLFSWQSTANTHLGAYRGLGAVESGAAGAEGATPAQLGEADDAASGSRPTVPPLSA